MADTPALVLCALCSVGGLMGFLRKRSVPSLIGGVGVGAMYGVGALRMRAAQPYGVETALAASVLLALSSLPRAIRVRQPLPIGLTLLSGWGLYVYGKLYQAGGATV